jgi:uncharacterized protein YrrD
LWKNISLSPNANERELTQEELLQFQIALNRRLAHALSHIRNNQIINLEANKITTKEAFITTAQIENLIVGDNVTMGENASISWEQVTDKPEIPEGYTDQDVLDLIQGTYIDNESVWTISVYAQNITAGFLKLVEGMKIGTEDETIEIDKDGIRIVGGKISIKGDNTETVIDKFGINPKFLDYSKNLIWNSSFEVFNSENKPLFWDFVSGSGVCSRDSTFYSDRSLKLNASSEVVQSWAARTKPWWIKKQKVRVSMYVNFVQTFEVRVVDIGYWAESEGTNIRYYKLNGTEDTTLEFTGSDGWEDSRISFTFDSGQYDSDPDTENITAFALMIKNTGTGEIYIDGVMAHVDFTGSWAQLYKDGPRSVSSQMLGDLWQDTEEGVESELTAVAGIHVGATAPDNKNLLWLDTTT